MHQKWYFAVWREEFCSDSFSIYCLFYSFASKESIRRAERSSLRSLLRNSKENKCSKIKMQIKGRAFVPTCLCVWLQRDSKFHGLAVKGFAGVTSFVAGSWSGVWSTCVKGWKHSTALRWSKVFRKVLGREFQLFHSSWSRHCDTIPAFLFVHGGDRALMKYTERKQRKNNLNGSNSPKIPPAQHSATFTTPLPWLIPGSLEQLL